MLTLFMVIGIRIQARFDFTAVSTMPWTCYIAPEIPKVLALVSKCGAYGFLSSSAADWGTFL